MTTIKTSCLSHPPRNRLVLFREDFLAICEGNHCAAAILAVIEYWTNWKLDSIAKKLQQAEEAGYGPEAVETEPWIYKTIESFMEDLLNLFGRNKIQASLIYLVQKQYLKRRHNPRVGFDRTHQYLLNLELVQKELDKNPHYKPPTPPKVYKPTPMDFLFDDEENTPTSPQTNESHHLDLNHQPESTEAAEEPTKSEDEEIAIELLTTVGITEPALSQLKHKPIEHIHGWIEYAQDEGLEPGFIIKRLRANDPPPSPPPDPVDQINQQAQAQVKAQAEAAEAEAEKLRAAGVDETDVINWQATLATIEGQMAKSTFNTWLKGCSPIRRDDTELIIGLKNKEAVEWIEGRLLSKIQRAASNHGLHHIKFEVRDNEQ